MINLSFLPWQQEVFDHPARFKVVAAGRRVGKSRLARNEIVLRALNADKGWTFYVAPTQGQARQIMWRELLDFLTPHGLIDSSNVNNLDILLKNGQMIGLRGADRPDTMRGVSLNYLVLDEYADIKPQVWDEILRPALSDQQADALFIGTPKGRNGFYDLYKRAKLDDLPDWEAWTFTTSDNHYVPAEEIESAKKTMPSAIFRQEYEARFESMGGNLFKEEWFQFGPKPKIEGDYYVAIDLAGFGDTKSRSQDNSAIAIVFVHTGGWWVEKVHYGRWELKETANKIFSVVEAYRPTAIGIERGIAKQAVMSPLEDLMRSRARFFKVDELTHGNQKKTDRIMWALQGRFENGLITLNEDERESAWMRQLLDELSQFPDPLTHDDLVDSLAYIDQIASVTYHDDMVLDYAGATVIDYVSGY